MENKEQLSQLELNIKALEKDGIKVKHMSGYSGYHSKDGIIQLKDIDYKNAIVSFYHSSFDDEKDSDGDIIQKGSFAKTIRENFARMKHLYNHDRTLAPGVVKEVAEDNKGCYTVSQLVPTTLGKDVLVEYEYKVITEHSMGYGVDKQHYDKSRDANIITEIKLWEVSSLTAWGANKNTPVKSQDVENLIMNIEKLLRSSNISDERGKELELKLVELLKVSKSTPLPPKKKAINWGAIMEDLHN